MLPRMFFFIKMVHSECIKVSYYQPKNQHFFYNKSTTQILCNIVQMLLNIYSANITAKLLEISKLCIPNKIIRIRPSEPTWMNSSIKKLIRKRKRAFRKAKRSQSPAHWAKFKQIRNDVVTAIRQSKKSLLDNLANKLKNNTLTSRDWWTTLKSFISPDNKSSIPHLDQDGTIYSEDFDKANVLNDFFCKQTMLNDENVSLPELPLFDGVELSNIVVTCDEVESVLKALPIGKATGPDGINNCILRELAHELSPPLCSLFNQSLHNLRYRPRHLERSTCVSYSKGW